MRAKLVYEKFSEESDPIEDMSIGPKYLLKQWFDSIGLSPKTYIIYDDLRINVKDHLYLEGSHITKLPDNLTIEGDLNLEGTEITELPDNLCVGGYLDIEDTEITELPDNLVVNRTLYMRGTKITKIPHSVKIGGDIWKSF